MIPKFLRSEVVPYARLDIVHVDGRVTRFGPPVVAPVIVPDCPTCDGYAVPGHVCPHPVAS